MQSSKQSFLETGENPMCSEATVTGLSLFATSQGAVDSSNDATVPPNGDPGHAHEIRAVCLCMIDRRYLVVGQVYDG